MNGQYPPAKKYTGLNGKWAVIIILGGAFSLAIIAGHYTGYKNLPTIPQTQPSTTPAIY